jgi:RND superfamily putative drug exporter
MTAPIVPDSGSTWSLALSSDARSRSPSDPVSRSPTRPVSTTMIFLLSIASVRPDLSADGALSSKHSKPIGKINNAVGSRSDGTVFLASQGLDLAYFGGPTAGCARATMGLAGLLLRLFCMYDKEAQPIVSLKADEGPGKTTSAAAVFAAIARFAIRCRWQVIAGWLIVTLLAVVFLPTLGDVVHNDTTTFLPASSPSLRAAKLASPFIHEGVQSGILVAIGKDGPLAAGDQQALTRLEGQIRRVPEVTGLSTGVTSGNGRAVTEVVQFSSATAGGGAAGSAAVAAVRKLMLADTPSDVQIYLTGTLPVLVDQQHAANHTEDFAALLSVLLILVVLAVAFRAVLGPVVALAPAGLALMLAEPLIAESTHLGVQISSLLELLLTALMLGAGTDYGLFILFRYRENLGRGLEKETAIVEAMSRVGGAVGLSALTVIVALSSLVIAQFGLYRGVGPGLALGIFIVLAVEVTLLPALLSLVGGAAFWPSRAGPHWSDPGIWGRVAARVTGRPVAALVIGVTVFGALSLLVVSYAPSGFNPGGTIKGSDSAAGATALSRYFGISSDSPTDVVLRFPSSVWQHPQVVAEAERDLYYSGRFRSVVGSVNPNGSFQDPAEVARLEAELGPPQGLPAVEPVHLRVSPSAYAAYRSTSQYIARDGRTALIATTLRAGSAGSTGALQVIPHVRALVAEVATQAGANRYGVTGEAAGAADVSAVSGRDVVRVVPVVLVLLTLLLALGLRSLIAPLYLVASVALSYLASLGLAVLIFQVIGGAPGVNFSLPFFLFVFVMALGEDYNILVMGRIREEAERLPPREAVSRAILATGGTITAAGLVLSGTFGVLAVVTSGQIRQIGAGLALGVLLDTFVVRTLLVPSTAVLLGRFNWWPSSLWRTQPAVLPEQVGGDKISGREPSRNVDSTLS